MRNITCTLNILFRNTKQTVSHLMITSPIDLVLVPLFPPGKCRNLTQTESQSLFSISVPIFQSAVTIAFDANLSYWQHRKINLGEKVLFETTGVSKLYVVVKRIADEKRNKVLLYVIEKKKKKKTWPSLLFLGAIAKLRKAIISFVMSVRPTAWHNSASHWTDFHEIWC
jgi:hypothetical protein